MSLTLNYSLLLFQIVRNEGKGSMDVLFLDGDAATHVKLMTPCLNSFKKQEDSTKVQ
jgi:hypothetical protein